VKKFFAVLVIMTGCGTLSNIPVPTSVSVQAVDGGLTVCTTISADMRDSGLTDGP